MFLFIRCIKLNVKSIAKLSLRNDFHQYKGINKNKINKNMTTFNDFIEKGIKSEKIKLGFGLLKPDKEILESLRKGSEYANIVLIGSSEIKDIQGFEKVITERPEEKIIEMLVNKEVDAIIRGTIGVNPNYDTLG